MIKSCTKYKATYRRERFQYQAPLLCYLREEMVELPAVSLKHGQLLAHPPNAAQVIIEWAELFSDLSRDLIDLLFAVFSDLITASDNLISLEEDVKR